MHDTAEPEKIPAADLFILARILHDWPDAECAQLLALVASKLHPGGAVLICEMLLDDDRMGPVPALMQSLNMLVSEPTALNVSWPTGAPTVCTTRRHNAGLAGLQPLSPSSTRISTHACCWVPASVMLRWLLIDRYRRMAGSAAWRNIKRCLRRRDLAPFRPSARAATWMRCWRTSCRTDNVVDRSERAMIIMRIAGSLCTHSCNAQDYTSCHAMHSAACRVLDIYDAQDICRCACVFPHCS